MLTDILNIATHANALLLCGPAYVGKSQMAAEIAAAQNCLNPSMLQEACGNCESCRMSHHPDILEIAPRTTTSTGKEAKRKLISVSRIIKERDKDKEYDVHAYSFLEIRPFYKRRIVLIKEADTLTPEAANSLLKLMEEPPHRALFILLTEDVQAVLPTLVSRSIRINVVPKEVAYSIDPNEQELHNFIAGRMRIYEESEKVKESLFIAKQFHNSLQNNFLEAIDLATTFEKEWNHWHYQTLSFVWRDQPLHKRVQLDQLILNTTTALEQYVSPSLVFLLFAFKARMILRS